MSKPLEKPASRLQELRVHRGLTGSELARRSGVLQPTLSKIDLGQRGMSRLYAPKIAEALGVPVETLYAAVGSPIPIFHQTIYAADHAVVPQSMPPPNARPAPEAPDLPVQSRMPRDVPVFGSAQGGTDGAFELNYQGGPVDYVRRPPGLMDSLNVFAIYVEGESMSPWREPGQFVYVHNVQPPRPGDYVVIVVPQEEPGLPPLAYIKRLVRRTATEIIASQYNPAKELTFPRHDGVKLLRVIDWDEALGF